MWVRQEAYRGNIVSESRTILPHGSLRIFDSVDSLLKLHRKTKSIDAFLDDRTDMSTVRRAWSEVRDNIERGSPAPAASKPDSVDSHLTESQTRQAFLSTLTLDAVNSLMALKVHYLCCYAIIVADRHSRTRKPKNARVNASRKISRNPFPPIRIMPRTLCQS